MAFFSDFIEGIIFKNDARRYWRAEHFGMTGESIKIKKSATDTIDALMLKPSQSEVLGTVLFFESAHYNHQFHIPQVSYLCQQGFRVVMFDYSGFGLSSGKPSFDGLISDAECVYHWLKTHFNREKFLFFAQGIGCDVALRLYQKHSEDIAGLVLESAYSSRKGWIKDRWGPVVGDLAAAMLKSDAPEPYTILPFVKAPVLIVFPEKDNYVHDAQRKAVLKVIPKSAEMMRVPKAKFLGVFIGKPNVWHEKLLKFFLKKCLKKS